MFIFVLAIAFKSLPFEKEDKKMTINEGLRMVAGLFILLSVALGYWAHPAWFFFTAFVGVNLFQSAFTHWCPMMWILRKVGLRKDSVKHQAV